MARRPELGWSIAVWAIAVVALLFFLRAASALLIPIAVAIVVSYAAEPVVALLARALVPRPVGAAVILVLVAGAVAWGLYSLREEVAALAAEAPAAAERIAAWAGISDPVPDGGTVLLQGIGWMLSGAANFTIVVMLAYFLLISGDHFKRRVIEASGGRENRRATADVFDDINRQIQRFLLVQVFTSVVVGVATWLVLMWMQVPQAAVWGSAAGLFNSIPYFGPVIVSGGLLVVGLLQSGDPAIALRMAGAALVITSIEGWLLNPLLMGRAERMHVVAVFVGVLLWTWLWGAWGTLLAVPMLVVVKAVCDHVEPLQPISRLLAR